MHKIIFLALLTICILTFNACSGDSNFIVGSNTIEPVFTSDASVSVNENQLSAITLVAVDYNSSVTYSISDGDSSDFDINAISGVVVFKIAPDYETKTSYTFTAMATDTSDNKTTQDVTINILDIDENTPDTEAPTFTSDATASVYENQLNAITLIAIDDKSSVTYSIKDDDSADFNLNYTTGVVTFKTKPDFQVKQNYSFVATAMDATGNSTTQDVTIIILDGSIEHNGVKYKIITSPYTDRIWLDRNIGASAACLSSLRDTACFGDYYQWGRDTDGHEKETSPTTSTQATDINNAGDSFVITKSAYKYDWALDADSDGTLRAANWGKIDGNSVCPIEFRLPTVTELTDEIDAISISTTNTMLAFKNFLQLPFAGYRSNSDGIMASKGFYGSIWSSNIKNSNAQYLYFDINMDIKNLPRAYGRSVRCIKD